MAIAIQSKKTQDVSTNLQFDQWRKSQPTSIADVLKSVENKTTKSIEAAKGELKKTQDGLMKITFAEAQNAGVVALLSEGGGDSSNTTKSITDIQKMNFDMAAIDCNIATMEKMSNALSKSTASSWVGKKVGYDDSFRIYEEYKPLSFDYKFKDIPKDTQVKVNIKILDSAGVCVYEGIGNKDGFKWDGRNNNKQLVAKSADKYQIKAQAKLVRNGKDAGTINADTLRYGIVDAVEYEGNKIFLNINGLKVDINEVTLVTNEAKDIDKREMSKTELLSCVGKSVTIDTSTVAVNNGECSLTYNNHLTQPEKGGKVAITLNDNKGNYVKTITYDKLLLSKGNGLLTIKKSDLTDVTEGVYSAKIRVYTDSESQNSELLNSLSTVEVVAVDVLNKTFTDNFGANHKAEHITKVNHQDSSLINTGNHYIGARVSYDNDFVELDNGAFTKYFYVPDAPHGYNNGITKAELEVYQDDKLVAKVEKNKDLYLPDVEKVPEYSTLHQYSQQLVKDWYKKIYGDDFPKALTSLVGEKIVAVKHYIEQAFRGGVLFKDKQDMTNNQVRLKNMGKVDITWNGDLNNGNKADTNEEYRYKLNVYFKNTANEEKAVTIATSAESSVISTDLIDSQLWLILANRKRMPLNKITNIAK